MKTYACNSLAEFYKDIYSDMMHAPEISPKGVKTKELIAPQILLTNPRNRLAYHKDRKFSTKYAIAESLLLFDSTNKLEYFSEFNKNMNNFSDDGYTLNGSYGHRIANNIPRMIYHLDKDIATRQAVLPILGKDDVFKKTKDTPCTLNIQVLVRDNKLNMIVNMRSNDIIWGLPYDIFMFTTLQEIIANTLGLELGWYLHRPGSLHLYETHYKLFENVAFEFINKEVTWKYKYTYWKFLADKYKYYVDYNYNLVADKIFFDSNPVIDELFKEINGDLNV